MFLVIIPTMSVTSIGVEFEVGQWRAGAITQPSFIFSLHCEVSALGKWTLECNAHKKECEFCVSH